MKQTITLHFRLLITDIGNIGTYLKMSGQQNFGIDRIIKKVFGNKGMNEIHDSDKVQAGADSIRKVLFLIFNQCRSTDSCHQIIFSSKN